MIKQEKFKEFVSSIIERHFPDESLPFEIAGDEFIQELYENGNISEEKIQGDKFGLIDPSVIKPIIEMVGLLVGTYKAVSEILKLSLMKLKKSGGKNFEKLELNPVRQKKLQHNLQVR